MLSAMIRNLKQSTRSTSKIGAFSVVEMTLFLAILGIVCGLGLIQFVVLRQDTIDETRYRRNAQELAAACSAAQAAGIELVATGDLLQTIKNVLAAAASNGATVKLSPATLKSLSATDFPQVQRYLSLEGDMLVYRSPG